MFEQLPFSSKVATSYEGWQWLAPW